MSIRPLPGYKVQLHREMYMSSLTKLGIWPKPLAWKLFGELGFCILLGSGGL